MPPIKAVLFDMFDTLMVIDRSHDFHTPALKRMYDYLYRQGVTVTFETFKKAYIQARDELYVKADLNLEEPHFNVRVTDTLNNLGFNNQTSSQIVAEATCEFYRQFKKNVRMDEHTEQVLKSLYGKYKLGLVSNFAIPECVNELLSEHKLDGFFDLIMVSGAVNKRKPNPKIFEDALQLLGVGASEAVFVGDTADADVAGAKSVGMQSVYLKRRFEEGLERFNPDFVILRLCDLLSLL